MIVLLVLIVLVITLAIYDVKQYRKMHFAKATDGFLESNNSCTEVDYDYFKDLNNNHDII